MALGSVESQPSQSAREVTLLTCPAEYGGAQVSAQKTGANLGHRAPMAMGYPKSWIYPFCIGFFRGRRYRYPTNREDRKHITRWMKNAINWEVDDTAVIGGWPTSPGGWATINAESTTRVF